jgi:hypothetical protein
MDSRGESESVFNMEIESVIVEGTKSARGAVPRVTSMDSRGESKSVVVPEFPELSSSGNNSSVIADVLVTSLSCGKSVSVNDIHYILQGMIDIAERGSCVGGSSASLDRYKRQLALSFNQSTGTDCC